MKNAWELLRAAVATMVAVLLSLLPGRRLANWGATAAEVNARYKGDDLMPEADLRLIRAITIEAPPPEVWPWVAQIGRGAGYYSYDVLDNGGRPSADHLLDIPPPALGDRNAEIGDVVHVEPGSEIVWLKRDIPFLGITAGLVLDYRVVPTAGHDSRVVMLFLGYARGPRAGLAKWIVTIMDYVMAAEQLRGLRKRAETAPAGQPARACTHSHQRNGITYAAG